MTPLMTRKTVTKTWSNMMISMMSARTAIVTKIAQTTMRAMIVATATIAIVAASLTKTLIAQKKAPVVVSKATLRAKTMMTRMRMRIS